MSWCAGIANSTATIDARQSAERWREGPLIARGGLAPCDQRHYKRQPASGHQREKYGAPSGVEHDGFSHAGRLNTDPLTDSLLKKGSPELSSPGSRFAAKLSE